MSFVPSGVITLTTDFGHKGVFVGTMKGQMLRRFAAATIVDLTHDTLAHWPDEAGFWLSRSLAYFPPGTVHVAVVDPGVGTGRQIIAVETGQQVLLAPDNGLLGIVVGRTPPDAMYRLDQAKLPGFGIKAPSQTFHGRDIFAPLAAEIAAGRLQPGDIGPAIDSIVPAWLEPPRIEPGQVSGVVVTTDHFGNLITNIDRSAIAGLPEPSVVAGGREFELRTTYGDVTPGAYLALINSFDVVEIARAEKSAAEGLGLGRGAPVIVR